MDLFLKIFLKYYYFANFILYIGFLTGAYTNDQRLLQYVAAAFNLPHVCGIASMNETLFILQLFIYLFPLIFLAHFTNNITGGNLLSNKHDYPTFMRTSVPDSLLVCLCVRVKINC